MTFSGPDASPLTKQQYLNKVHRILDVATPAGPSPEAVEFQGRPADLTSKVPHSTSAGTLMSVVRTPVAPSAWPPPAGASLGASDSDTD